ncbi:EI24 domain-containing protein, partial [Sulfurimonas sp. SAG-AH-194-L11]
LPFSMLRSNGAWILSSFLWITLVLVTFAIVFAFSGSFIFSRIKKEKYVLFSTLIVLGSALFWGIVWFFKSSVLHEKFKALLTQLPFQTTENVISYLIAIYLIYSAIIVTMVFVSSIRSKYFLEMLNDKEYPYDTLVDNDEINTIKYTLKDTFVYISASLVLFPLFFVPVLNLIIQIILWVWLLKDTVTYDVGSVLIKEFKKNDFKEDRLSIILMSALASLFNLIPVFNIFAPYFAQLMLFEYIKNKKGTFNA